MLYARWSSYARTLTGPTARLVRQLRQRGRLTPRQRVIAAALVVAAVLCPMAAFAADGGGAFSDAFVVRDSHGLSISAYQLSLDEGSGWSPTGTGNAISAWLAQMIWSNYVTAVSIAIWLLDTALRFRWLEMLTGPMIIAADTIHTVIERTGLVAPLLTLAAVIALFWLFRGRYGAAVSEVLMSLVMASLLGGALANPVATLAGPNGLLTQSQQLATELVGQVMVGGRGRGLSQPAPLLPGAEPPASVKFATTTPVAGGQQVPGLGAVEGRMIEIFVRQPHQIANYGAVIDSSDPRCATVYDQALASGGDDVRAKVGDCAEKYAKVAADPANALTATVAMMPSGSILVLFMAVMTLCLIAVGCLALWEALRLTFECLRGILPGQGRAAAWQAAVGLLVSLGMLVGVAAFTAIYLQLLSGVFSTKLWQPQQVFVLVDVLLLIGTVLLLVWIVRSRTSARRMGANLAQKTSPRPVSVTNRTPALALAGTALAGVAARRRRPDLSANTGAGAAAGHPKAAPTDPAVPGSRGAAAVAGRVAVTAAKVGLASTVGLPVSAPRAVAAARTVMTARRAQLGAKLEECTAAVSERVDAAREASTAYAREYVHNLGATAKFAGTVSGTSWAAAKVADATAETRAAALLAATARTGVRPGPDTTTSDLNDRPRAHAPAAPQTPPETAPRATVARAPRAPQRPRSAAAPPPAMQRPGRPSSRQQLLVKLQAPTQGASPPAPPAQTSGSSGSSGTGRASGTARASGATRADGTAVQPRRGEHSSAAESSAGSGRRAPGGPSAPRGQRR